MIQDDYSDYLSKFQFPPHHQKTQDRKKRHGLTRLSPKKFTRQHPLDLPSSIEKELNEILGRITEFFENQVGDQSTFDVHSENDTMMGLIREINKHLSDYIQKQGRLIIAKKKTQKINTRIESDKEARLKLEKETNISQINRYEPQKFFSG
jgi:hypothetical protein